MARWVANKVIVCLLGALVATVGSTASAAGGSFQGESVTEPLSLYRLICYRAEADKRKSYILIGMTSRRMPVAVLIERGTPAVSIQALASRIAELPPNTRVYVADPADFIDEHGNLSRLPNAEVEQLKNLLAQVGSRNLLIE